MGRSTFFHHRVCAVATKHHKERVIAPILSKELGVHMVSVSLDTDLFGTFTGEISRSLSPLETLRGKCDLAYKNSGISLIVASEGSFGPHPKLWFVPADEEFIMLKDYDHQIEIVARCMSTETNYSSSEIHNEEELMAFVRKCGFPDHAIILKSLANPASVVKGIKDENLLLTTYSDMRSHGEMVFAETDMRAMHNPTRMRIIEQACLELIRKIESSCPNCSAPGFDISSFVEGLPCESCGAPTRSALSSHLSCNTCGYFTERKYPLGKEYEDPMYCDFCNP